MLSPQRESLQKEHFFCLHLFDFEGNTSLWGKIYRQQAALVLRLWYKQIPRAEDFPVERY